MLLGPNQIAAAFTPKNKKPHRWFHSINEIDPHMTAMPNLWRHCVGAQPMWNGGNIQDVKTRTSYSLQSATEFALSKGGIALKRNTGITSTAVGVPIPMASNKVYTYLIHFIANDTSGNSGNARAQLGYHGAPDASDGIGFSIDTSGNLYLFTFGDNTGGNATVAVDDGEPHAASVVFDQVNDRMAVIIDGEKQFGIAYTDSSQASDAIFGLPTIGTGGNDSVTWLLSQAVLESDNQIPQATLRAWTQDPWAFYRPAGF